MTSLWRWNVRAKLLTFAAIVLAPILLVAYLTAQNYVASTRAQILSSSAATATLAVTSVEDFLAATERLLHILAANHAVQNDERAAVEQLFTQTLTLSPELLTLYILGTNDEVQICVPPDKPSPNQMRYGLEALRHGRPAISGRINTTRAESSARVTAALAVPIRRKAQTVGALGAEIAVQHLQRSVADAVMREHAVVVVFDHEGRVLVAPEPHYYADDIQWNAVSVVQAALRGEQGAAEYRNPIDGHVWLGAYAPIRRGGWAVLVSYPSAEVFAPLQSAIVTTMLSLGGVLLCALTLAAWLASRFTRPVQYVQATALAIARGDYAKRVPQVSHPHDEIEQLAIAFNQMATALQQHMVALMHAQREIEQKARELQQLLARSVAAQEAERQRIAQDIHDGITQMLVGALYEMQAAKQALTGKSAPDHEAAKRKLNEALTLISDTVSEMRRVIFDLHPTILDELGLVPALNRLVAPAQHETLQCALRVVGAPRRLPAAHELALYRIAQEALHNVRQHAEARRAQLELVFEATGVRLMVSDDGKGFAPEPPPPNGAQERQAHLGLMSMKERAQSIGGTFTLKSNVGHGTTIVVNVPFENPKSLA
jgi:signal transduction histidine kinase